MALCGMHAINNLIDMQLFRHEDLVEAVQRHLATQTEIGGLQDDEDETWHVLPGGWFSSEVLPSAIPKCSLAEGLRVGSLTSQSCQRIQRFSMTRMSLEPYKIGQATG